MAWHSNFSQVLDDETRDIIALAIAGTGGLVANLAHGFFSRKKQESSSLLDMAQASSTNVETALALYSPLLRQVDELNSQVDRHIEREKKLEDRIEELQIRNEELSRQVKVLISKAGPSRE